MQKVFKFATGQVIPENALFLSTQVEKTVVFYETQDGGRVAKETNTFVWHYFLVQVEDDGKRCGLDKAPVGCICGQCK